MNINYHQFCFEILIILQYALVTYDMMSPVQFSFLP